MIKGRKGAVLAIVVIALSLVMILTTFILQLTLFGAKWSASNIKDMNNDILLEYIGNEFKSNDDLNSYKKFFVETKYKYDTDTADTLKILNKDNDEIKFTIKIFDQDSDKVLEVYDESEFLILKVKKNNGELIEWSYQ